MNGFESLAVESDKPRELKLNHPLTGQPLIDKTGKPAMLLLYGMDSEAAQKHKREATTRVLRRRNRNSVTAEELEAQNVEFLVSLTAGWYLVNPAGEPVDFAFSAQNARQLYSTRLMSWIREQADEFVGDRATFLQGSQTI